MDWENMWDVASVQLTSFALKAAGAVAVWIVGRYLIALAVRLVSVAATRQRVDPTILRYLASAVTVTLNVVLVVAILGYFGVETTSFAALLAAAGVAIGAAWAGLLSNFAGGAFLIVLRPFKVGDYVKVGGVEGTVTEIGLFATTLLTPDNVTTYVGNGKIFGDTISNYSASTYRRVDREAQLAHSVNPQDAIARLREALLAIPNVEKSPPPTVEIIDFNERGTRLAVRPYTHTDHYWQVYFDTNRVISEAFGAAGYPVPEAHVALGQKPAQPLPAAAAAPVTPGATTAATA
jgi:small conductance mechanosensitive channel